MRKSTNQGARRSAYVDTHKAGNAEWAAFSCLPAGLGLQRAARGVAHPRKAGSLAAVGALRPALCSPNVISFHHIGRP